MIEIGQQEILKLLRKHRFLTAKEIALKLKQRVGLININLQRLEKIGGIDFVYDYINLNKFNKRRRVKKWYLEFY